MWKRFLTCNTQHCSGVGGEGGQLKLYFPHLKDSVPNVLTRIVELPALSWYFPEIGKQGTSGTCCSSDGQGLEISQHCFFYASMSLLFQIRVLYSEVGLEAPSSASLPRKPAKKTGTKHRKSRSMDSFDSIINNSGEYEEDNFSDTDNEEEWQKEAQQSNQKDWEKETHQSNANEWQNEAQQSTYV